MRAGRLVHDGTIRRVSGGGLSPRDGSFPNNAATAEAFFRFVASRMSSAVDSEGLLSDYRSIIGADPDADDSAASKGLSPAEYAALKKVAGSGATGECAVCMTAFQAGAEVRQLPCNHHFCEKCTKRWMDQHTTCPMCRRDCRFADLKAIAEQRRVASVQQELWSPPEPPMPRQPAAPRPSAAASTAASPRPRPTGVQRGSPATTRSAAPPVATAASLTSPRRRRQPQSHSAEQAPASPVPPFTQSAAAPARRPQPSPRGAPVRLSTAAAAAAAARERDEGGGGGGLAARTPRRIYQTRPPSPRVPNAGALASPAAHRQRGGAQTQPLRVVARATTPPGVRLPRF